MRRRALRWVLWGLGGLVLLAGALTLRTLHAAGAFTTVEPVGDLACTKVPGLPGAEDLVVDRATDTVYVSSTDRHAIRRGTAHRGDLFAFHLGDPEGTLRNLTADQVVDFRPHGIDLHVGTEGTQTLMAVNRRLDGHPVVEIFRLDGDDPFSLRHLRTVSHELLISPNDIAAAGPDAFYVTNDHTGPEGWRRTLKDYLLITHGTVVHWDGARMRTVAEGLRFANGVALSPDGEALYVAETTGRAVRIYGRDAASGRLTPRARFDCATGVDNIDVDDAGHLWIGAHPQMLRFAEHAADPSEPSPSEVLRVDVSSDPPRVETVWRSKGEQLSGSSAAVAHRGKLLIGSVFEPHILICDQPSG